VVISLIRGFKQQESGQALVELALVLPLFLLLLFGLIQMSIFGYAYISVNNAAREAVRFASVGGKTDSDIIDMINESTILTDLDIQFSPPENPLAVRQSGDEVTVNISYPVSLIVPIAEAIFPNPFIIKASLSMRIE